LTPLRVIGFANRRTPYLPAFGLPPSSDSTIEHGSGLFAAGWAERFARLTHAPGTSAAVLVGSEVIRSK
jgi:hypothetical protein